MDETTSTESDASTLGATAEREAVDSEFDDLLGIVTDGVVGALGGLVGTAAATVGLFVAASLGAFDLTALASLPQATGLGAVVPIGPVAAGWLVFLAGGMFIWPLLFAATAEYLPGRRLAVKGLPFGFVLWTGFALAFVGAAPTTVPGLLAFAALTLASHLVYGFSLGAVYAFLRTRPETLV
ncbi:MAG: DUF6789 family protein [Haloarculaceae archaeon]